MLLYHLFVVGLNSFTLYYDQKYVDLPFPSEEVAKLPFKARIVFLTYWCLVCQTIYFTIATLNDVIGTNAASPKKPPLIRKIKDLFYSLAFTLAIYVFSVFWVLYTLDRRYIFPSDEAERLLPVWLNHTSHTFIAPFILIELLLTKRNYPSIKQGISLVLLFYVAYMTCIHFVYYKTGFWPYPFLHKFSFSVRLVYFASCSVIGIGVYLLGDKLNSLTTGNVRVSYTNGTKKH